MSLLDVKYRGVIARIEDQYGITVSFDRKMKGLRKFGRNLDLDSGGGFEQVWTTGGLETLSTTNDITHIASTSASDTARILSWEGHTIDGSGNLTFVAGDVTINGQAKVALPTPLARITRLYNKSSPAFLGTITVAKNVTFTNGVPASDIHATILPEDQQTLKCATSMSQTDLFMITELEFSIKRSVSSSVDFKLQVREKGGVWRTQFTTALSSDGSTTYEYFFDDTQIIVPPNADVRILAESSTNNTVVDAVMVGLLATVTHFL